MRQCKRYVYIAILLLVTGALLTNSIFHANNENENKNFKLNKTYPTIKFIKENSLKVNAVNQFKLAEKVKVDIESIKLQLENKKRMEERKRKLVEKKTKQKERQQNQWQIYEITFYTSGYESTGKYPSHPEYRITASGKEVQAGVTVACPKELPFGTKLYIEGFGERVCEDRGGAIKGKRLDIFVESLDEAYRLGRQKLKVKIIN